MPHRFISLLLIFVLALQATLIAPVNATAHADASAATGQMAPSRMDHADCADRQTHAGKTDCPCCPDAVSFAAGCASFCIAALAVLPAVFTFTAEAGASYAALMAQPLLTRCDIPPTPPPIA